MTLHAKLEQAVMAALPKKAPKPTFKVEDHWSQELPVLMVDFDGITVGCGFHGNETDADLEQYAQNIVAGYEAQK